MTEAWPFGSLAAGEFDLIVADPPWQYKNWSTRGEGKGAAGQYDVMSLDDIKALPVAGLAAPDCMLWLWATNPMLPVALDVMAAWGFTFKTAGHWAKWNADTQKLGFGTGYILRSAGEPFLIGSIGKPVTSRAVRSVVMGKRREHSRKPDEAFAAAEALMPGARKVELFSRQPRAGWANWGNEKDKWK
jgi:N6-adenosine-specific RNA methylase IME4